MSSSYIGLIADLRKHECHRLSEKEESRRHLIPVHPEHYHINFYSSPQSNLYARPPQTMNEAVEQCLNGNA